ncbi:MAG TPA: SprT family zinc-dependent metalloprotease [Acidiferrobacterales bacterium]
MSLFRRAPPLLPDSDELLLAGAPQSYRIDVSPRRRTLCLQVHAETGLRVIAPAWATLDDVRGFVAGHAGWIARKRALFASARPAHRAELADGTLLPFLGGALTLRWSVRPGARRRIERRGDELHAAAGDVAALRIAVESWYKTAARDHAATRIAHFAPRVGRAPRRLSIRAQRSRWGSCSARGTVSLNWRLMQLDAALVDYVIVHELCHLLHPNHSPRFWAAVARVLPECMQHRRALRRAGEIVVL